MQTKSTEQTESFISQKAYRMETDEIRNNTWMVF